MDNNAYENYSAKLSELEQAASDMTDEQILEVLIARNLVDEELAGKTREYPAETLINLMNLDDRLKKQAELIHQKVSLNDWRTSMGPGTESWWWFLEIPDFETCDYPYFYF